MRLPEGKYARPIPGIPGQIPARRDQTTRRRARPEQDDTMAQDATPQQTAPQQGASAPQAQQTGSQQTGSQVQRGAQQQGQAAPQRQFIDLASI